MQVFLVDEAGNAGDLLVNTMGNLGGDTTYQQQAGTFALKVNATCDWRLSVYA